MSRKIKSHKRILKEFVLFSLMQEESKGCSLEMLSKINDRGIKVKGRIVAQL